LPKKAIASNLWFKKLILKLNVVENNQRSWNDPKTNRCNLCFQTKFVISKL